MTISEQIKNYIVENYSSKFNELILNLYINYFTSLYEKDLVPEDVSIYYLIDKVALNIKDYVFYDSNDKEFMSKFYISSKNKGFAEDKILYVNINLSAELIEITFYHELTHLLQNHDKNLNGNNNIGVMKNFDNRLLMEAQTQIIAETVYSNVYGEEKATEFLKSEDLRMLPGGKVASNLRNYQMYDNMLRKLLILLDISLNDFIKINFHEEESYDIFEKLLDEKLEQIDKENIKILLDKIYSTDVMIYCSDNEELLSEPYIIESLYTKKKINVSSIEQQKIINILDYYFYQLVVNEAGRKDERGKLINLMIYPELLIDNFHLPLNIECKSDTYIPVSTVVENPQKQIKVFDESKMKKSVEEYDEYILDLYYYSAHCENGVESTRSM